MTCIRFVSVYSMCVYVSVCLTHLFLDEIVDRYSKQKINVSDSVFNWKAQKVFLYS